MPGNKHPAFSFLFIIIVYACFFLLFYSSCLSQCLIKYILNLSVSTTKLIGSPFFYCFHHLGIDSQDETFNC